MLVTQQQVFAAQRQVLDLHMAPALQEYIVQLVLATRDAGKWDENWADWSAMVQVREPRLDWIAAHGQGHGLMGAILFHR